MGPGAAKADELIEFWTLLDEDREELAGKRGATALGFALLLKHYSRCGRFPRGRSELSDAVVGFVARQLGMDASELGFYEWSGSTIEYHRAHLGFRVATVADQEKLTEWLAISVAHAERRPDRVREELLAQFRKEHIEPPTSGRLLRMVRSALRAAEKNWTARISSRLDPQATACLLNLVGTEDIAAAEDELQNPDSVLGLIKSASGNVSLDSMMTEISKLQAVRAVGLPTGLFADVAPRVLDSWRARASVEAPSHLRHHAKPLTLTLLAAPVHDREREITDTLVELLIATVHRIGARAERRVTDQLVNAFKRVTGKENLLFSIAEAALAKPDDAVREVVFPAVSGGEQALQELVHEFRTKGPVYRRTVQTTLRASYTGHYRRGLIALLEVLEFRSNNAAHRPVIDALTLIGRYAKAGNLTYYPLGETVPAHRGTAGDWSGLGVPKRHPRPATRGLLGGLPLARLIEAVKPPGKARRAMPPCTLVGIRPSPATKDATATSTGPSLMYLAVTPQTLLATEGNGEPPPAGHGALVRLRTETRLGFTMVNWARAAGFVDEVDALGQGRGGWSDHQRADPSAAGI
ncbi:MAG: DUF4158 domain-containing protein [Streptosporangiaceae bacterium]